MTTANQTECPSPSYNINAESNKFRNSLNSKRRSHRMHSSTLHNALLAAMTSYVLISTICHAASLSNATNAYDQQQQSAPPHPQHIWRIIPRTEWQARTPAGRRNFTGPSPYVIVHHSYQPGVCLTLDGCKAAMRSMQHFHMDEHGWRDIGYSFAVGGDGNVYEGRGFDVIAAHAPKYNNRSIGLLLIGDYRSSLPPDPMLRVAQEFLAYAVEQGHLNASYTLYGHRQVRNTECPGDALFAEIQKWPHYAEKVQEGGKQ